MSKLNYLINITGACRHCQLSKEHMSNYCNKCNAIICDAHYDENTEICELCKYSPPNYFTCFVCEISSSECQLSWRYSDDEGVTDDAFDMAFSDSSASCYTRMLLCNYCVENIIKPYIKEHNIWHQSTMSILDDHGGVWLNGPTYDMFRKGNDTNYDIIQAARAKIINNYRQIVPQFILPDVAIIIIQYCQFSREIMFIPCIQVIINGYAATVAI